MLLRPDWEPRISRIPGTSIPPLEGGYRTNISNQDINDRFLSDSYPLETSGGPYRHSRELQLRSRDPSLLRERRKKTVRFDSGNLSDEIYESEADLSEGWLTLHDQGLRRIKRHPWPVGTFPGRSIPHAPGSIHPNHPHWDRQESQDSTARFVYKTITTDDIFLFVY